MPGFPGRPGLRGLYEVIAIDDSSDDATWDIISEFASRHSNVVPVSAKPKPDDWMGKNWACMEGVRQGDRGSFAGHGRRHEAFQKNDIDLQSRTCSRCNLDALSVIPRMLTLDVWTRITLPMISTFLPHQVLCAEREPTRQRRRVTFLEAFSYCEGTPTRISEPTRA